MFGLFKKKERKPEGPDFSQVDTREKAEAMFQAGDLEKLFLLPETFGGKDIPVNTLFVPVGIAEIKHGIDENVIGALAAEGKVTKYKATPEYTGKSHIPIVIKIVASDPGRFETVINIWGEALGRK